MVGEIGREMLFAKITRPYTPKMVSFNPGLFTTLPRGSLLVYDNVLLEQLQLAITRAAEDNTSTDAELFWWWMRRPSTRRSC